MSELLTAEYKDHIYAEILAECDLVADCWIFKGATNQNGYGMKKAGKTSYSVSRFVLAYASRESLGSKYDACHCDDICPYKACCNPDHLYWATKSDNCKAREKRAREEREMFTWWDSQAWIDGVYCADRRDPSIDRCLANLSRGKIVHATTKVWEEGFIDEIGKVFNFLADIGRQTWERMVGYPTAP